MGDVKASLGADKLRAWAMAVFLGLFGCLASTASAHALSSGESGCYDMYQGDPVHAYAVAGDGCYWNSGVASLWDSGGTDHAWASPAPPGGGFHHVNATVWMRSSVMAPMGPEAVEVGWWLGNTNSDPNNNYQGWYESDINQLGLFFKEWSNGGPPTPGAHNTLWIHYSYYDAPNHRFVWLAQIDGTVIQYVGQSEGVADSEMVGVEEQAPSFSSQNWTPTVAFSGIKRLDEFNWPNTWTNWSEACNTTFVLSQAPYYESMHEGNFLSDFTASIGVGQYSPNPPAAPTGGQKKPFSCAQGWT